MHSSVSLISLGWIDDCPSPGELVRFLSAQLAFGIRAGTRRSGRPPPEFSFIVEVAASPGTGHAFLAFAEVTRRIAEDGRRPGPHETWLGEAMRLGVLPTWLAYTEEGTLRDLARANYVIAQVARLLKPYGQPPK
jgi:hypothetical protein